MDLRARLKNFERHFIRPLVRLVRPSRGRAQQRAWQQQVSARLDGFQQHLPALLNAISSVAAFGHELASVRRDLSPELVQLRRDLEKNVTDLWGRVEFVRKEILYKSKYGTAPAQDRSTRILSPEKLEAGRSGGLKLNLGCGHVPLNGYLNVDQRELPGVDIMADVGALPFETDSVQEIFSSHVLEHVPQQKLRRLLPYWRSLLKPEGQFRAVVPDGEAMLAGVADGSYPFEHFREVLFGAQEYEGDFHFNLLTPSSLSKLMQEAGFRDVTVPAKGRKNDICFEFEILGSK